VSASERELLQRVAGLSVALFIVLNKADYLDEASLAEAQDFTASVAADVTGRPEQVYPVSARRALATAGDPGFATFAAAFASYLESGRSAGLELSAGRQARRIGQQLLDQLTLAQHAARLPGAEAEARVAAFLDRLDAVSAHRVDAEDRAAAQSRRLLQALNLAAEQDRAPLAAHISDGMTEMLNADLTDAATADIERQGRSILTGLVKTAVEHWRQRQADELERGLQLIDEKLAAELEADLGSVRSAASDLLGLELTLPAPGDRLEPATSFFYVLDEQVDQAELLAGFIRRRLPGGYGRRLARDRLLAQVPDLVGSQIGRARGDLQYRLAEATRRLLAELRWRYADTTDRLSGALEQAAWIRAAAGEHSEQQLADLAARERALRGLLDQLPAMPVTPSRPPVHP
jgi:hypothetical protein